MTVIININFKIKKAFYFIFDKVGSRICSLFVSVHHFSFNFFNTLLDPSYFSSAFLLPSSDKFWYRLFGIFPYYVWLLSISFFVFILILSYILSFSCLYSSDASWYRFLLYIFKYFLFLFFRHILVSIFSLFYFCLLFSFLDKSLYWPQAVLVDFLHNTF